MADPYVIFPGTPAGNYLSTEDTNLLDADTAHGQQGLGGWVSNTNAALSIVTPPIPPIFGVTCIECVAQASGADVQMRADNIGIVADTEQTFSAWVLPTVAGLSGVLRTQWSGNVFSSAVELPTGVWTQLALTTTSDVALTTRSVHVRLSVTGGGDIPSGEGAYVSAISVRVGSDPAFVPSLRIVGTLFEEIVPADMPISFAGDGTPLTVGDGWAGDGYSYRRYDGADASAPLVAEFLASDIPVAAQLPA